MKNVCDFISEFKTEIKSRIDSVPFPWSLVFRFTMVHLPSNNIRIVVVLCGGGNPHYIKNKFFMNFLFVRKYMWNRLFLLLLLLLLAKITDHHQTFLFQFLLLLFFSLKRANIKASFINYLLVWSIWIISIFFWLIIIDWLIDWLLLIIFFCSMKINSLSIFFRFFIDGLITDNDWIKQNLRLNFFFFFFFVGDPIDSNVEQKKKRNYSECLVYLWKSEDR